MIHGVRVRQVRELLELTQEQLAVGTDVSQGWIAQVETGQRQPSDAWVASMAKATGFPTAFFAKPPDDAFPFGSLLFRAQAAMTQGERKLAHRWGELGYDAAEAMLRRFPPVTPRIPLPEPGTSPIDAAELARAALGISPDTPISGLIRHVENAGVVVIWLNRTSRHHDAYSLWAGRRPERPVVVGLGAMSGARQRFSVAHELAHLVLHRAAHPEVEDEANAFARELLLPRQAIADELPARVTLAALAPLKARWGVSFGTLVRRAHDLGHITDRQYRYLNQQISANGWRSVDAAEPGDDTVPFEHARALAKMLETLYGPAVDLRRASRDLGLPVHVLRELLVYQARRPARAAQTGEGADVVMLFANRATRDDEREEASRIGW